MNLSNVVLGVLGAKLDRPSRTGDRWSVWRPTVSVCQHEDFLVSRFDILFTSDSDRLMRQVTEDIANVSPETEVVGHELVIRDPWDFEEVYSVFYDFARAYTFDRQQHDYLVHMTTGTHVQQICLFLLAESRHIPGKLLQTAPPKRSSKRKPTRGTHRQVGRMSSIDLDLSRYDRIARRFSVEQTESHSFLKSGIDTKNAAFNQLIEHIEKVVRVTRAPILLSGPTGAGKTQLARKIFELKKNRQLVTGDLVEINCATLRGDQAMSTLFGHEKGAFTGATVHRPGLLRTADAGVLFLDEIGELGLDEQAMLLRAVEDKCFHPVGSDKPVASDFQLIAGTNRDLKVLVNSGRFREDLLARIDLWDFQLPGLADRREDIEPNLDFELEKYAQRTGRRITMNREARARFLSFATSLEAVWSANFRDLNSAVTRMGTLAADGRIDVQAVDAEVDRLRGAWAEQRFPLTESVVDRFLPASKVNEVDLFDRVQLNHVLSVCLGSRTMAEAGRKLFAYSRLAKSNPNDSDRLRKYLAKFDLTWKEIQAST